MAPTPPNAVDPRAQARASVRAKIAQAVFTIFAERGFEQTTATEAAEAAGISRASFFRYFSTKEEAVFAAQEAMGENIAAALLERPTAEDDWTALRRAADAAVRNYERSPTETLRRVRLARTTPALRAHELERQLQWRQMIGDVLAGRIGRERGDVRCEALAGAAIAALDAAVTTWAERGESADLIALIDQAFEAIRDLGSA
ncbi:MAG: TetR family transcriptional regulator [Actinobacteria bacterium]|nr:TetR family transcriptional regulator [Actinomycetota bacterium]